MNKQVLEIGAGELHLFRNHPFQVRDDAAMEAMCDSIREYGILSLLLARPAGEGYELISGHRRQHAAMKLGLKTLPVLVRELTDDEATIIMVDSNHQREKLLPSEKAFAYKMKLEAIKHQGQRSSVQVAPKLSTAVIGESAGVSKDTIKRYIRLTHLAKLILDLVDEGRIAFSPAVELYYLTKHEQAELRDIIQAEDSTPSLSQDVRMKKLSREAKLTRIQKYFPIGTTPIQMEEQILSLLEDYVRQKHT